MYIGHELGKKDIYADEKEIMNVLIAERVAELASMRSLTTLPFSE